MLPTCERWRPRVGRAMLCALSPLLLSGGVALAAEAEVVIKRVPISEEQAALEAGEEIFQALCAVCHGVTARGDGPAVPALKTPVPDLTRLLVENDGAFPESRVLRSILGEPRVAAHGSREMPMWGAIFEEATGKPALARLRGQVLTSYVESIQVPLDSMWQLPEMTPDLVELEPPDDG